MTTKKPQRDPPVIPNCILRGTVGSSLHGLALEGLDDRDEMAVYIEPIEDMVGFSRREHIVFRTRPEGVASGPGDLDLVAYGLRKFCRLAQRGDLSVLLLLFAPEGQLIECSEEGRALRRMADQFVLVAGRDGHLGYLRSQRSRLTGATVRERERSEQHGYDTKYAMHALRVGHQALELATRGRVTLPVPEPLRSHLMDVRRGEVPLAQILNEIDDLAERLERVPQRGQLPDPEAVLQQWMISTYLEYWQRTWQPMPLE